MDFVSSVNFTCNWSSFEDPHSQLDHYKIGLGTYPFGSNMQSLFNIGIQNGIKMICSGFRNSYELFAQICVHVHIFIETVRTLSFSKGLANHSVNPSIQF